MSWMSFGRILFGMGLSLVCVSWSQLTLTGVVRDFPELVAGAVGGNADFNQTKNANGVESYGCFDNPSAGRGAVEVSPTSTDVNPDKLPGFISYERDNFGPILKPAYTTSPNCFRSHFQDWYTTRSPDINRAFFLDLNFVQNGNTYQYDNADFFPLDDLNLPTLRPQVPSVKKTFGHRQTGVDGGVDVSTHNYGFTFEFHAQFTFKAGTGQQFKFSGDDDVWVYINDQLVIDLGGIHSREEADVNLDNLGLIDGQAYPLDFFFAERRQVGSRLTITTSLVLKTDEKPIVPTPPVPPVPPPTGPFISKAYKTLTDTSLTQNPVTEVVVQFSEPVQVSGPGVLKFKGPDGKEVKVDFSSVLPEKDEAGYSTSYKFALSPASANVPGEGYKVAIAVLDGVKTKTGKAALADNPWVAVESKLPSIYIGGLRAEKGVVGSTSMTNYHVKNPFVLLESRGSEGETRSYIPLHPETAETWIREANGANPGLAVFDFLISHPARLELMVYDNIGQFINRTEVTVTREDLAQSGKLARDANTRAYLIRYAWLPVSEGGTLIASGAYILAATFTYGLDPRDNIAKGTQRKVVRFGFLRGGWVAGLESH